MLDLVQQGTVVVLRCSQASLDGDDFTLETLLILVVVQLERVRISDQLLQPLNFAVQACAISLEVIDLLSLLVQVTTHQSLALVRLFVDIALDFSLAVKLSLLQLDELLPQLL